MPSSLPFNLRVLFVSQARPQGFPMIQRKDIPFRNVSYLLKSMSARKHSTQGRRISPRFHPACFPWKTFFIHVMITESPCHIKAAPRWYSVSRNIRAIAPCRLLSEMTGQLTVLFNAFTTVILHHKHRICQPPIAFTILEIPISLMRSYSCFLLIAHHLAFQPLHDFLLKP